ncbi:hypothetical protein ASZ90_002949 [hydrocarbon metagenome]|uniref:Uncharacterized protein n=1 Tax=hydrocarbon metagenome TaxID=938273 RepID=A0A0W8G2D1_9ZZZZ
MPGQGGQGQPRVAEQAVARNGPGRLGRVVGDLEKPGPVRQACPRGERIIAKDRRPGDEHEIVSGQGLAKGCDGRGQNPGVERMVLGEGNALRQGGQPDRGLKPLRQGYALFPGPAPGDVAAVDQHRACTMADQVRKHRQTLRVRGLARGHGAKDLGIVHGLVPVVHGQGQEHRPGGRLHGHGVGPHERGGNVLCAARLVAPFDPGLGQGLGLRVGQKRLPEQHAPGLLPGGDEKRRLAQGGGDDVAHGVAEPGVGVHVDQHRGLEALRQAVGDTHHARLVKPKDICKISREIGKEGLFRRARVAHDGGQPQAAEQTERHIPDSGHTGSLCDDLRPAAAWGRTHGDGRRTASAKADKAAFPITYPANGPQGPAARREPQGLRRWFSALFRDRKRTCPTAAQGSRAMSRASAGAATSRLEFLEFEEFLGMR